MKWTVEKLRKFEENLIKEFEAGKIHCPLHLSGGNESELITLFRRIGKKDYVFSTHRNHYHYLLKGGCPIRLTNEILDNENGKMRSMNFCDPTINFYSSAIVGGNCALAVGVALGLRKERRSVAAKVGGKGKAVGLSFIHKNRAHVWCFVGDGGEDTGHFMEAVRFGLARDLPLTFVVEDNDRSTDSSKSDRWHNYQPINARNILRYSYVRTYPHVGIGKHVTF